MALTPRQQRFYVYTADVWRRSTTDLTKDDQDFERVIEGIKCQYESSPDDAQPSVLGRSRHDLFVTLDRFHFELSTEVRDGDFIQMTAGPGGFNVGQWWTVRGNVQTHGYRANVAKVLAQQTTGLGVVPDGP